MDRYHSVAPNASVAQLVVQRTCNAKVEGSSPFTGTNLALLAQSGEHCTVTAEARGSKPLQGAILKFEEILLWV